jgi:peptidoglycan LD-endopeptidase CwlK
MKDRISIERVAKLHPDVRELFVQFITECEDSLGICLRITQGWRSADEQQRLYEQGRTRPGKIVTNAAGGHSYHNYGLAVDLAVVSADGAHIQWDYDMAALKPYAGKYEIEWGGDWKSIQDRPHFQRSFGLSIRELLALHKQGRVDVEGYVQVA